VSGVVGTIVAIVFIVGLTLDLLIPHIPISVEQALFTPVIGVFQNNEERSDDPALTEAEARRELQEKKLEEILSNLVKQWP
ncbi:uncharacterized protein METZ01_LOCUS441024, partial [marine metagenome]